MNADVNLKATTHMLECATPPLSVSPLQMCFLCAHGVIQNAYHAFRMTSGCVEIEQRAPCTRGNSSKPETCRQLVGPVFAGGVQQGAPVPLAAAAKEPLKLALICRMQPCSAALGKNGFNPILHDFSPSVWLRLLCSDWTAVPGRMSKPRTTHVC